MRHDPVYVERLFWSHIRDRKLNGWKFRRQVLIGPYIADYVCAQRNVVVELDGGGVHRLQQKRDRNRDSYLRSSGCIVLRFENSEVLRDLPGVLSKIVRALEAAPSPWPSPPEGERVS